MYFWFFVRTKLTPGGRGVHWLKTAHQQTQLLLLFLWSFIRYSTAIYYAIRRCFESSAQESRSDRAERRGTPLSQLYVAGSQQKTLAWLSYERNGLNCLTFIEHRTACWGSGLAQHWLCWGKTPFSHSTHVDSALIGQRLLRQPLSCPNDFEARKTELHMVMPPPPRQAVRALWRRQLNYMWR